MHLTLIVPGDPGQRTGGYLYDAHITAELRALGWQVDVIGLAGQFPNADVRARQAMSEALASLPDGHRVVIDGLALGGVPDSVEEHAGRLDLIGLVHHPLSDETGLDEAQQQALLNSERLAIGHCRKLIVTSPFTRNRLAEVGLDHEHVSVVEPGVELAALSERVAQRLNRSDPDGPQRLLCVASLSPRKGQDVLLAALAELEAHDWLLNLVGSAERDPTFANRLKHRIQAHDLESRVHLLGELDQHELAEQYHQADLCLLPSWYEGYGMVVSEALARGLPLITTTGGALADTVPASAALKIAPGDQAALRDALEQWLGDSALRLSLSQAAAEWRANLDDWTVAAAQFADAVQFPEAS